MGPEDLRGMIRRVESFIDLWPQLQPLQQQLARQGGIEEIGGTSWERPAVAGRQNASTSPVQTATPYAAPIAVPVPAPHAESPVAAQTKPVAGVAPGAPFESPFAPSAQPVAAAPDVIAAAKPTTTAPDVIAAEEPTPMVLRPSVAVVMPAAAETVETTLAPGAYDAAEVPDDPFPDLHAPVSTSDSEPLTSYDDDWSPPPPTPVEPPRVASALPPLSHSAPEQELPSPGAPGRFRVELIDPGPNPTRTAELLARALRVSVDEAAAWCAAAPVCVAVDVPAYEVRKIDVVVRMTSGARFQWEQLPTM
jgi:hypothetical protein